VALGLWTNGNRASVSGRGRVLMLALGGGFVGWNFLSMLWAAFPADAWSASDKTLVYIVGFAAFALWPTSDRIVVAMLAIFAAGVCLTGIVVLARASAADSVTPFLQEGRLSSPTGYPNGGAALWMLGLWPCLYLATSRARHWLLRAALLGAAAFVIGLAILAESRGWIFALPVAVALFLVLARQRLRSLLALLVVGVGAAVAVRPSLDVFDRYEKGLPLEGALHRAAIFIVIGGAISAALGLIWAIFDRRIEIGDRTRRAVGIAVAVFAIALAGGGAAAVLVAVNDPGDHIAKAWHEFASGSPEGGSGSRLTGSLGSPRYEVWKIAAQEFADHPVQGLGADNYYAQYLLRRGDNYHDLLYPHSIPLRLLSQLGLVGTALFAGMVGLAIAFALRRRRAVDAMSGGAIGAALTVFGYWLVHGSIDVFWEIPALAAPALGLLGLAASPRASESAATAVRAARRGVRQALTVAGGLLTTGACISLVLPWFSFSYLLAGRSAAENGSRGLAYARFDRSAGLNPLDAEPYIVEGSIAAAAGDGAVAEHALRKGIGREPRNWYGYLQLALLAGSEKRFGDALGYARHAQRLNPRDPLIEILARLAQAHQPIDPRYFDNLYERGHDRDSYNYLIDHFFQVKPFTGAEP
jgi:hypothetical protein